MNTKHMPADNYQPDKQARPGTPLNSQQLFGRFTRIEIEHRGDIYRLQITRQGKLILTK